jgi:NAD(P)-dependent dehydrogenase (short-subunit alcohol dehydrogenase family)
MTSSVPTVMITGAAGNLGRSVAQAFRAAGANLVLVDRQLAALQAAFRAEDSRQVFAPADLLDAAAVQAVVAEAAGRFGSVNVLCHLAGGFRMGEAVHETGDDTWQWLFDINVRTLLHAVRAVVPAMLGAGGGHIVAVGALSARQGLPLMGAYCAAKDAVARLCEAMAAELGEKNIRVNCVLPSVIDTPENRAAMPDADTSKWVAPADIAQAMLWLASSRARAVQGVTLPLAGSSAPAG